MALRRAPEAPAAPPLAGTGALAALLRLLPLAQLLIMWRLDFSAAGRGISSAFYAGLALWALLVVVPLALPLWKALGFLYPLPCSQVRSSSTHFSGKSYRAVVNSKQVYARGRLRLHLPTLPVLRCYAEGYRV